MMEMTGKDVIHNVMNFATMTFQMMFHASKKYTKSTSDFIMTVSMRGKLINQNAKENLKILLKDVLNKLLMKY